MHATTLGRCCKGRAHQSIVVRPVDTDVQQHNSSTSLSYGLPWEKFRYIAAHEMAKALGHDRCTALPMFHAFTGCDTYCVIVEVRRVHGIHDEL